jgi:hypothetical protein
MQVTQCTQHSHSSMQQQLTQAAAQPERALTEQDCQHLPSLLAAAVCACRPTLHSTTLHCHHDTPHQQPPAGRLCFYSTAALAERNCRCSCCSCEHTARVQAYCCCCQAGGCWALHHSHHFVCLCSHGGHGLGQVLSNLLNLAPVDTNSSKTGAALVSRLCDKG